MANTGDGPTGICPTCAHFGNCHLCSPGGAPVQSCEEYEPSAAPVGAENPGKEADAGTAPGLCSSCGRRETCTYARPGGGIWDCEDYE